MNFPPPDMTQGTYIASIVNGEVRTVLPVGPTAMLEACEAIGRASQKVDKKTVTFAQLAVLYDIFYDWLCDFRVAEGPEPTVSPLRKDTH